MQQRATISNYLNGTIFFPPGADWASPKVPQRKLYVPSNTPAVPWK